jgi:hypothetical protein
VDIPGFVLLGGLVTSAGLSPECTIRQSGAALPGEKQADHPLLHASYPQIINRS